LEIFEKKWPTSTGTGICPAVEQSLKIVGIRNWKFLTWKYHANIFDHTVHTMRR
jgi:hypothetical protein